MEFKTTKGCLYNKRSNVYRPFAFAGLPKTLNGLCCVLCIGLVQLAKRPTNEQEKDT